jgi:coproporphyrinogen III oxidase-like Fe-S oxidoreductase
MRFHAQIGWIRRNIDGYWKHKYFGHTPMSHGYIMNEKNKNKIKLQRKESKITNVKQCVYTHTHIYDVTYNYK